MKTVTLWSRTLVAISLCSLLGGCVVGPNYRAPRTEVPDTWQGKSQEKEIDLSSRPPLVLWWKAFNDPLLDKYIVLAISYNNEVEAAAAHVLEARAARQVSASAFYPQVFGDLNGSRTSYSKNGPFFSTGTSTSSSSSGGASAPAGASTPQQQNLFNALFDATWEIDLFGKTRRSVQAAEAGIGVAMEEKNDLLISIAAETARNYMELRSEQKRKRLIEERISLLEEQLVIIRSQREAGYVNQLDVEGIESDLASMRAALPESLGLISRAIYALSTLTGNLPEALLGELLEVKELPSAPKEVALGLRSDILRRRPDVRRAERQLAQATANVGVAVASFFPTVSLLGDGGMQSVKISNLFQSGSKTWSYGGDINMPIFEGGRLIGNLKASKAVEKRAAALYQQTVLKAIEEAETSLAYFSNDVNSCDDLLRSVEHKEKIVALSSDRFEKGLVNKLDLLRRKNEWVVEQESLLNSRIKSLVDLIALYKSLGGGWE